jgi:hypothetical protein
MAVHAQPSASDGASLLSATLAHGSPALRRRVNQAMRDGRRGRLEQERIPFFCECIRIRCDEPIWLTGEAYDHRRAGRGQPLLLHGHEEG